VKEPTHLIVFDLDGTLLDGHGAGHQAMERAFGAVLGMPGDFDRLDFAGRTDPAMLRLAAERVGVSLAPDDWPRLWAAFVDALKETVGSTGALPGVRALLDALKANPRVGLAVGTGNIEAGADLKLRAAGLDGIFDVGGYGSDGESREEMLAVALARGRAFFEAPGALALTVGDTPRDVAAAHYHRVPCIAVATGHYTAAELSAAAADAVLPSLADRSAFYRAVEAVSGRPIVD
jgi:phosphoglycolate phosphatase